MLVGFAVLAFPAGLHAGALGFRNDTEGPVIVQGMSIINGKIYAGKRHVLQPGDIGWDRIVAQGSKLIVVSDAKQPTKTLYQGTIQFLGNTQFYSIKTVRDAPTKDGKKSKAQKPAAPKIELESTTPPVETGQTAPRRP